MKGKDIQLRKNMEKWYELSPDGKIVEADWKPGSVFVSHFGGGYNEVRTDLVNKKPRHGYTRASNEKHARRKFHKRKLI